jgi:hypothetical protein
MKYNYEIEYDYEIDHDEVRKVNYPEIARAAPLTPCVAIGAYNKLSKSGYIGFAFSHDIFAIENALDLAVKGAQNIKDLVVGIAGAGKVYNDDEGAEINKSSDERWELLEKLVSKYNLDKSQVKMYKGKMGNTLELYLDCKKGRIVVKKIEGLFEHQLGD